MNESEHLIPLRGANIGNATRRTVCRSSAEVNALITIYSSLVCVIVASNAVIVITFVKNRKLRSATNLFFVSLAVSDILVGAVSIPMWIAILAYPMYNSCKQPREEFFNVYKFLDIFSAVASTAHLMAISFERSMAISHPLRHRSCPRSFFYIVLAVAWLYGLSTSVIIVVDFTPIWTAYRAIFVFIIGFAFPLVVIMILYASTYRSVKQYVRRRRNNSAGSYQKHIHKEKRTAKTVGIVVIVFIIAWLPFFVVSLVTRFSGTKKINFLLIDFVKILYFTNSAVNPFIYAFRNRTWKRIFLSAAFPCPPLNKKYSGWYLQSFARNSRNRSTKATSVEEKKPRAGKLLLRDMHRSL